MKAQRLCYNIYMIGYLNGTVIDISSKSIILDVHGVGYTVYMTNIDMPSLAQETKLYIETVVREDAIELFGFKEKSTKDFFTMLTSISGIGPRGAIGILNLAPVEVIINGINKGDSSFLTKVSGIGKKTAEKIILELRDKVSHIKQTNEINVSDDIFDALTALGYSPSDIRSALANLPDDVDREDTQKVIRSILKIVRKN